MPVPATNALLTVLQSELSPATIWETQKETVTLFGELQRSGLGGPTFLAYSSPTGISVAHINEQFDGALMRESWLFAGFTGADGWVHWDSPWAVFLQRRPLRVRLDTNGVHAVYDRPAGQFALMPLYGYYKPPQEGQEFLSKQGLKEKDLLTWEWKVVVARDPLMRLRYWAGAVLRFPLHLHGSLVVDRGYDTVTLRQRVVWLEREDEWNTRPIRIAPVSPSLGLALVSERKFPVEFSRKPLDFQIATPHGPYFGVPDADDYEMRFPVLQYIHEHDAVSVPADASPVARAAMEKLRQQARALFGGEQGVAWPSQQPLDPELLDAVYWYACGLPYYDDDTRTRATDQLRALLRERVLSPEHFVEVTVPANSERSGLVLRSSATATAPSETADIAKINGALIEALWAYAHHTGDHALIIERWPVLRRLLLPAADSEWPTFGRGDVVELGLQVPPVVAFARLAYMAGDLPAYHSACGRFVRALLQHHLRQGDLKWFRENQPWHSLEPIEGEVYLTHTEPGAAGWQMDGPEYPRDSQERWHERRWRGFRGTGISRFYQEHLGIETAREMRRLWERWNPTRHFEDQPPDLPSLVRLQGFLLSTIITNVPRETIVENVTGSPAGVIASCLAIMRSTQPPRYERLIPAARPSKPITDETRESSASPGSLVQEISLGTKRDELHWPQVRWPMWRTPTGAPWSFGEVRVGTNGAPAEVESRPISSHARQYLIRQGSSPR